MSYLSAEMKLVCSTTPADWATRWEGVLPFCRDAICVFYGPSRLGLSLGRNLTFLKRCSVSILQPLVTGPLVEKECYLSAEMQLVYSTVPAEWALSLQAIFNYHFLCRIPILLISYTSNLFYKLLKSFLNILTTISFTTFVFNIFFRTLARLNNFLIFRFLLFLLCCFLRQKNPQVSMFFIFLFIGTRSGLLAEIKSSILILG